MMFDDFVAFRTLEFLLLEYLTEYFVGRNVMIPLIVIKNEKLFF